MKCAGGCFTTLSNRTFYFENTNKCESFGLIIVSTEKDID